MSSGQRLPAMMRWTLGPRTGHRGTSRGLDARGSVDPPGIWRRVGSSMRGSRCTRYLTVTGGGMTQSAPAPSGRFP